MKIAIVGFGASALGVASFLKRSQVSYEKLDIISPKLLNLNHDSVLDVDQVAKRLSDFPKKLVPRKVNINEGISDDDRPLFGRHDNLLLWGCSCLPFPAHHLEKIANFSEIDFFEAYKEVTKAIPIAGNDNEPIIDVIGSEHLRLPCLQMDHTLSKLAKELNYRAADYQIKSGTAHIAISGIAQNASEACDCFINNCRVHTTFSLRDFQARILDFNIKINRVDGYVTKMDLNKKILYIKLSNENKTIKKSYDLVFVCAGAFETAIIMGNSENKTAFEIAENTSYVVPFLSLRKSVTLDTPLSFSLTNAVSFITYQNSTKEETSFIQFYPISRYMLRSWFPLFLWPIADHITNLISRYLFIAVVYLDDRFSSLHKVSLDNTNNLQSHEKVMPENCKQTIKLIVKLIKRAAGATSFVPIFSKSARTSHHFGKVKVDGKLLYEREIELKKKGIYFCGSSVFKYLPPSSPTLTVAAHSYLVAKEALAPFCGDNNEVKSTKT